MANINKIKVGSVDPDAIMFDKIHENMSNLKFDFTKWTKNEAFPNDITVEQGRITIRKFKPNTWIIKSPDVTGSQNSAICTYCRGTIMHARGISNHSNIFSQDQEMRNIVGAGNDLPKFKGFCPYPMQVDGTYTNWMQVAAYTWEATWDKEDNLKGSRTGPGLADWGAFRLGSGGHGVYGIWTDFNTKTMFPDTLYDFNTFGRNPDNNVTWNYGFMLATGNVNDFDDTSWSTANGAVLDGKKVKVTGRLETTSTGWHIGKNCAPKACKIKVTGLSAGDSVHYGANNPATNDVELCTSDGTYDIPAQSNGGSQGFGFRVCGTGSSEVTLEFVNELTDDNGLIDVSGDPIVLELFNTNGIDVTSVECWDAHCGTTQVWHKDKTVENCWVKHRLALPNGWSLYQSAFSANPYIEWITATKFRVKGIPKEGISIEVSGSSDSNYSNINFQGFSVKMYNKPDSVTAVFSREFFNITTSEDVTKALNNGETEVAAFSKTVYRQDSGSPISYNQAKFTFSANSFVDTDFIVELVPIYGSNGVISLNTSRWSNIYSSLYIPETTDMESYMTKIKWNIKPANPDIWTRVKAWYESNTAPLLLEQFADSTGLTEITLNMPADSWYLAANYMFNGSEIKEVTLNVPRSSRISSGNHFFGRMTLLTTINVNLTGESEQNWGAAFGAVDCSGWFEWNSSIETYPANLINWQSKDSNVKSETTGCTLMSYAFDGCTSLKSIPSFDYEAAGFSEKANTIVPARYAEYMLNCCSSLQTIGPILDMKLVNTRTGVFSGLNALTSARIKNLNHGDWDFTGTLKALDTISVQYLFANLADLTTSDPSKHEDTIDKSFKNWTCNYFGAADNTPDWDYNMDTIRSFQARKRYATASEAPFVVSTNATLNNMAVSVSGLEEGDSVIFGASGDAAPDYTFTENDSYTITKTGSLVKGFKVLSSDPSKRTTINVIIDNGLDYTNPAVSSANLKCPKEWTDKVTSEMITAANAKGWTIYIGGVEVQPS